jgi:hypothetical protein
LAVLEHRAGGACSVLLLALVVTITQLHGNKSALPVASATSTTLAPGPTPSAALSVTPSVPPASTPAPAPAPAAGSPPVRRYGQLALEAGVAYDLDYYPPPGWDASIGRPWTFQNIKYQPGPEGPESGLAISDEPTTDVLMGTHRPWTYRDCAKAPYSPNDTQSNPNNIGMNDLVPGEGICIYTWNDPVNNPGKTDGGHYVLLVVQQVTSTALIVEVTVWQ